MRRSVWIAAGILLAATGWMASGQIGNAENAATRADTTLPPPDALVSVRTADIAAQDYTRTVVIRGRTEADRVVDISSEIDARVVAVHVEKGDTVQEGDLLVELAIDDRQAQVEMARAVIRQRTIEAEAATRLAEKGFRAETQLAEAEAQLEDARHQERLAQVNLRNTKIRAPFDGVVENRMAEIGAFMQKGSEAISLIDRDPMLVIGQVGERDVNTLKVGDTGTARLADGTELTGTIGFIGAVADPETRTFLVELEVPNPEGLIRDGLTAEMALPVSTARAHFISPAVLVLDDAGALGVRLVDGADTVRFAPITVIGTSADGMWVGGLPADARLIVVGQEYVVDGQKVRPVDIGESPLS